MQTTLNLNLNEIRNAITVCTVVHTGTFWDAATEEPFNQSTQNLAEVITSWRSLNYVKWYINRFRGVSSTKG